MKRRKFLKNASLTGVGLAVGSTLAACADTKTDASEEKQQQRNQRSNVPNQHY